VPGPFRAALCDLTFGDLERVAVDLFDLEEGEFTRSHALEKRFATNGEVWHVVGSDWVAGGASGRSAIQTGWEQGAELWQNSRFIVLTRPGHPVERRDLPPHAEVLELELDGSSSDVRRNLLHGNDSAPLLAPRAARYIERYGLYRGTNPATWSRGTLADLHCELASDPRNKRARGWAAELGARCGQDDPGFILALGGDGTMLRAIREHWRRRLPLFGVNAGHFGFLMNAPEAVFAEDFPPRDVIFRQLPLLFVEFEMEDGEARTGYAFNDAWVERSTSQSAWLRVIVNDVPRLPKLVADGALVSTAAGSTAYARSMGASPLLANSPAWLLVGSNVQDPPHWKSALLSDDSTVEIHNIEVESRPVCAYVDGIAQGRVRSLKARLSHAAAAELVFLANHDMAEKIAAIQFAKI
jgi:NAD+ kinase